MYPLLRLRFIRHFDGREDYEAGPANLPSVSMPIERIPGFRRPATRAHLSVDFRRWDPSWIPGIPFGRLPSNRPEVPIVLFEMRELETMLPFPLPSLRLEALVERSCSAQVRGSLWCGQTTSHVLQWATARSTSISATLPFLSTMPGHVTLYHPDGILRGLGWDHCQYWYSEGYAYDISIIKDWRN